MICSIWLALLSGVLISASPAEAQTSRRLLIQSKVDQYELVLSGNTGTVNGKPADLSIFKDLIPIVTNPMINECTPPNGISDVTVKEGGQTRFIYIKQGIVSDGKKCLPVGGEGLFYFPVHHDFLIGSKHDAINLKSPIKLFRQGVKLFELKKSGKTWSAANTTVLLNWDFIERFENSLKSFAVRFRVLPEMGQGKTKMILQSGDQTYEFYKLTTVVWAVKKPGTTWLEASDDWSFWYDFDQGVLEDRFAAQIHAIDDAKGPAERLNEVQKLDGNWSPNLRDLYHRLVLDKNTDSKIKTIAIQRLKSKPSLETCGVMVKFLAESNAEDLKRSASQILKINYPKGPLYNPDASAEERKKVVEFWSNWWPKNQNTP